MMHEACRESIGMHVKHVERPQIKKTCVSATITTSCAHTLTLRVIRSRGSHQGKSKDAKFHFAKYWFAAWLTS